MDEPLFELLASCGLPIHQTEDAWRAIVSGYTEAHRAYHTLEHLHAMFDMMQTACAWLATHGGTPLLLGTNRSSTETVAPGTCGSAATDPHAALLPRSVVLAAFFHDVVYDPRRGDNEEASADMALALLRGEPAGGYGCGGSDGASAPLNEQVQGLCRIPIFIIVLVM